MTHFQPLLKIDTAMFDKTFISVCFSRNKLLLLELNSRKKKIKKFASLDLPSGLIKNYQIQDKSFLIEALKTFWKKYKLKEKVVGIIVPEFSTYTKLLSIPKLEFSELGEAIAWQMQEFLPKDLGEMVFDWKIVGKKDDNYEILTFAIDKKVLSGYVEVLEKSGLFPMAVETPSLSLVRISGANESGQRLIIYKDESETLLIIADGGKIIGTSVQYTKDLDEIIDISQKFVFHYRDVEIKKIFVGGAGMTRELLGALENSFKIKVQWITPEIEGSGEKELQEYLIPICMQLGGLEEPSDPDSLNLLPLNLVEKYKTARLKLQIWSLTLTVTLFIWMSFLSTLGGYLYLSQQIKTVKQENLEKLDITKKRESLVSEIKRINTLAESVVKIKDVSLIPQTLLNDIWAAKPEGITLEKYKLDLDKGLIELKGRSQDRSTLIGFKNNLEAAPTFDLVDVPISSFEEEKDIEFKLTANISSIAVKLGKEGKN